MALDMLFPADFIYQPFCPGILLTMGDYPSDNIPAEDVEDDIKIKASPLTGPLSLVISQDQTWLGAVPSSSGSS